MWPWEPCGLGRDRSNTDSQRSVSAQLICGVLMFWKRKATFAVALALASTAALAFQEERQPQGAAGKAPAAETQLNPADVPGPAVTPQGTEISIPGLGKLGVIPKMNFGLDLLYGATGQQRRPEDNATDGDGLTIRGSIKHKF